MIFLKKTQCSIILKWERAVVGFGGGAGSPPPKEIRKKEHIEDLKTFASSLLKARLYTHNSRINFNVRRAKRTHVNDEVENRRRLSKFSLLAGT